MLKLIFIITFLGFTPADCHDLKMDSSVKILLENIEKLREFLTRNHNLPLKSEYILLTKNGKNSTLSHPFFNKVLRMVEFSNSGNDNLFKIYMREDTAIRTYNYWNGTRFLLDKPIIPRQNDLLNNKTLRAVTFNVSPSSYKENNKWKGYENRIMDTISRSLGFKLARYPPPKGLWGELRNGTFDGLVGELQFERADLGWANLFMKYDRLEFMDFSEAYYSDQVCFIYKKPPPPPQWLAITSPLDGYTWLCLFVIIIAGSLFLYLLSTTDALVKSAYSANVLLIMGTLIDQCDNTISRMKSNSLRLFFAFWLAGILVIATGYKGSLISVMTVPLKPSLIYTMRDTFFELTNKSLDQNLQKIAKKYEINYDYDMAIERMNKSEVVMGESSLQLVYMQRKDFTNEFGESTLHMLKDCTFSFNVAIGLPRNSRFYDSISNKLVQLKEAGLVNHYIQNEFDKAGKNVQNVGDNQYKNTKYKELGLYNIQVGLVVYGLGLLVAFLTLCGEKVLNKNAQANNRRNRHTLRRM